VTEDRRSVVVVGASAAGLRCACRLARLQPQWSITVVEARPVFSYAACGLPYALSGDVADAEALRRAEFGVTRDAEFFSRYKGVRVLAGHRATEIDVERCSLRVENEAGAQQLRWDDLVLATGAAPRRLKDQPRHPRIVTFHVWDDLKPLYETLARGELERVALVGAGLVGCELAEAFAGMWGAEVTLLEAAEAPLPGVLDPDVAACVAHQLRSNDIRLVLGSPVVDFEAGDEGVVLSTGDGRSVEAQIAVVAVGVEPVVDLARAAGVRLASNRAIEVDDRLATSLPGIWAVGDCTAVRHVVTGGSALMPLGSLANRQGRTLANVLAGREDAFPPLAGSVAVKVFDWNVAATGCTATNAAEQGLQARAVWISSHDRAHYWPESKEIHLKLVYEPGSRKVLGVQAVGEGDVVRRVDVAAQFLAQEATLDELAHLEHAYAPPYAPALEPLAVAAMVAQNQEDGVEAVPPGDPAPDGPILDVRLADEVEARPTGLERLNAIPLDRIRESLDRIDDVTPWVVCERGTRSAEAVRVLRGRGLRARYLGGGLRWRSAAGISED